MGDFDPSLGLYPIFGGRPRRRNKKPKRLRNKNGISLDFIKRKHQELSNSQNYVHFFKTFLYGLPRSDLLKLSQETKSLHFNIDERLKDMISMISQLRLFKPVQI